MKKDEHIPYEIMLEQLQQMSKEEIQRHLQLLGCDWSYDKIVAHLQTTYNDLQVADEIYMSSKLTTQNSPYTGDFIDEAILEIARREAFPFPHYGLLSRSLEEAMELPQGTMRVDALETTYRKLMKLAKQFHLTSLEGIQYQVNDGMDLISLLADMLDEMQQYACKEKGYAQRIVNFVEKYLQVFPKTNPFTKVMLEYEQAQAYIAMKSKKGEQIFQRLLKTHSDPTDVILHYGLAYLDDDETKTLKLFQRYEKQMDENSEAYDIIAQILEDSKTA